MTKIKGMEEAKAFAKQHRKMLALELCEWQDVGVLCDGKVRELQQMLKPVVNADNALAVAQAMATRAALEFAATNR